jgi:hypothetical protein
MKDLKGMGESNSLIERKKNFTTKNENLLFSKKNKGRFPELDEVFELLEKPV